MPSDRKAKFVFSIALTLLFLTGIGAALTIMRLYLTEGWVRHTYAVEIAIGDLESALAAAGRTRISYVESGTAESLRSFQDSLEGVNAAIGQIRNLVGDSVVEQSLRDRLEANAKRRVSASLEAVELKKQNRLDAANQARVTRMVASAAIETAEIAQQMRQYEDALLAQRSHLSTRLFEVTVGLLSGSFMLSILMLWIHYRLLNGELRDRVAAENQLRQLTVQLMKVRDEEGRRFARELHDGLGQSLVAAKLTADSLESDDGENPKIKDLCAILRDCVSQTRTISYLLHPPMLDEIGFGPAASWFVEGYSKRTGIDVSCHIAPEAGHLPRHLELTLFRILQEALTNIHRHSKSMWAEVSVSVTAGEVMLRVKDYGNGISPEVLAKFTLNGTHAGVGLSGMKERVRELHGEFKIVSDSKGTQIAVKMPLKIEGQLSPTAAG